MQIEEVGMKILFIDKEENKVLEKALGKYNFKVECWSQWMDNPAQMEEFCMVIYKPHSREDILKILKTKEIGRINLVIFYDHIDSRLIAACSKSGCKDIIRNASVNPESTANRLNCLIEGLSAPETSSIVPVENRTVIWSVEDYIRIEIKRSNRGRTPLVFIAVGFIGVQASRDRMENAASLFRTRLRDIDFVLVYKDFILVILPSFNRPGIEIVKGKLEESLREHKLFFCSLIKEKFYEVSMLNEKDILLGELEVKFRRGLSIEEKDGRVINF